MKPTKEQRFWKKVDKNGPLMAHCPELGNCWIWIGSIATDGYGKIKSKIGDKLVNERAHRVSWEIHKGKIPIGKQVCHHCDNILCVRDSHLFVGTNQDNVNDMISKGRRFFSVQCKLTEAQVDTIRNALKYRGVNHDLSRKFNVSDSVISEIRSGKAWPKLDPENPPFERCTRKALTA